MKRLSEKNVESYLRIKVRQMGGKAYKFVSPGNAGVPDRLVVIPGCEMFFVELKATGGKTTKLQDARIAELDRLGQTVFIADSKEDIDEILASAQRAKQNGI